MLEKALQRDTNSRPFEKEIKKLGEILLAEPALMDQLDTAPNKEKFIEMYVSMARERGIHFTREDLLVVVQEQKQGQDWILPRKVILMIAALF